MPLELDSPSSVEDLYLDRGRPVEPWRPVMQGDVFAGVTLHGLEPHDMVLVLSHPCSMRGANGALVPRLQAVAVRPRQPIPLQDWVSRCIRWMPLPELIEGDQQFYAGALNDIGTIESANLDLSNRLACLSERGILLFQQRFAANLARVKVKLTTLERASGAVLIEAELQEEWLGALAQRRCATGEDQDAVLAEETAAFDEFFGAGGVESYRAQLADTARRAAVRRAVRQEVERRIADA